MQNGPVVMGVLRVRGGMTTKVHEWQFGCVKSVLYLDFGGRCVCMYTSS